MTEIKTSPVSVEKNSSPLSDMDGVTNAPVTSVDSADDSHGLTTPESEVLEIKLSTVSRWANVQEALEACLDPFFLAGQSSVKDDKIVEELIQLMDTSLTAHVPALAGLSFLQPLFRGSTRSERIDAVLRAARASNKLILRDDLPVPSTSGFMLSVDEAEAACLRVGPRSHAEGSSRSVLSLERKPHSATVDSEAALRAFTFAQLQATVPQQKLLKVDRAGSPCVVRVVFVSPVAADRAYAIWRAHAPHPDIRVTRIFGGGGGAAAEKASSSTVPSRPTSEATRPATGVAAGAATTFTAPPVAPPVPRPMLKCPRVVGEALSRPSSSDSMNDMSSGAICAANAAAVASRVAVPVPKPPPAIDAVLLGSSKSGTSAVMSAGPSAPSTANTTPSPENSTTKSKFNMHATPFLPKSVLDAQLAAAAAVAGWWPRGSSRTRRAPGCEDVTAIPIDTSEALANQMLIDSSSGWIYPGLNPYNGPSWSEKFNALEGWVEGNSAAMCSGDISSLSSSVIRKVSPVLPERPKAVGGDLPTAPVALGDSTHAKEFQHLGGLKSRGDLYAPRGMATSLPLDHAVGCSNTYDAPRAAHISPHSQSLPVNLCASRRHRHDPYSPTGFVLCTESSAASSLSHPPGNAGVTSSSSRLLFASSLTSEKMVASFYFEDPLIKASARRRERRRLMQEGGDGAARTPSSEAESSSSNLEDLRSPQAEGSSGSNCSNSSISDDAAEPHHGGFSARPVAMTKTTEAAAEESREAAAGESLTPTPKSYAEALRLKKKTSSTVAVAAAKSAERKKEKSSKSMTGSAAAVKSIVKPKKISVVV